jgi:hypothetical protein
MVGSKKKLPPDPSSSFDLALLLPLMKNHINPAKNNIWTTNKIDCIAFWNTSPVSFA